MTGVFISCQYTIFKKSAHFLLMKRLVNDKALYRLLLPPSDQLVKLQEINSQPLRHDRIIFGHVETASKCFFFFLTAKIVTLNNAH